MKLANACVSFDVGISCFKALHMFRTCFFNNATVKLQAKNMRVVLLYMVHARFIKQTNFIKKLT